MFEVCKSKVRQRLLPMNVIDAEYQFDRHKLTFFFEADRCVARQWLRSQILKRADPLVCCSIRARAQPHRLPRAGARPVRDLQDAHLAAAGGADRQEDGRRERRQLARRQLLAGRRCV